LLKVALRHQKINQSIMKKTWVSRVENCCYQIGPMWHLKWSEKTTTFK
jgi:hypothetical protein